MSLNVFFTSQLPKLDLHGETRDSARVAINDFIRDSIKMKHETVVIIHGKGTGILKNTTQEVLRKNKHVKEFGIDYYNEGSTIVRIQFDKN